MMFAKTLHVEASRLFYNAGLIVMVQSACWSEDPNADTLKDGVWSKSPAIYSLIKSKIKGN